MTVQTRATLKGYFNTNDIPTETNFSDMLDTTQFAADLGTAAYQATGAFATAAQGATADAALPAASAGTAAYQAVEAFATGAEGDLAATALQNGDTPTSLIGTNFTGTAAGLTVGATTGGAVTATGLSQFAATSSSELAGVISDETGTGNLVFSNSPSLTTPALGTPSALVGTNITGTASSLTAGFVTDINLADGSLTLSGADALTLTTTAATNVTLPSGTATLAKLGANTFTGTQALSGNELSGHIAKVVAVDVTSGNVTLTATAHSGNIITVTGTNTVIVPTTAGFHCEIVAGAANDVGFNGSVTAAMAAGDVMTVMVISGTVWKASLVAAADLVAFV